MPLTSHVNHTLLLCRSCHRLWLHFVLDALIDDTFPQVAINYTINHQLILLRLASSFFALHGMSYQALPNSQVVQVSLEKSPYGIARGIHYWLLVHIETRINNRRIPT